jgi:m7GpppX diphosphatase
MSDAKKVKCNDGSAWPPTDKAAVSLSNITSLRGFVVDRTLAVDAKSCSVTLLGHFAAATTTTDGSSSSSSSSSSDDAKNDDDARPRCIVKIAKQPLADRDYARLFASVGGGDADVGDGGVAAAAAAAAHNTAAGLHLAPTVCNDVYAQYAGTLVSSPSSPSSLTPSSLTGAKVDVVFPATDKHIKKATQCTERMLVRETPALYAAVTRPYVETEGRAWIAWVYNILERKKETDTMLCADDDDDVGYMLHPDTKWAGSGFVTTKTTTPAGGDGDGGADVVTSTTTFDAAAVDVASLYCLAICRRRDLFSLRSLTGAHVPLLENMRRGTLREVRRRYGVAADQLRLFVHYVPSFWHLHVHVMHVNADHDASVGRCVLLDDIIDNLRRSSSYYADAAVSLVVPATHPLYARFRAAAATATATAAASAE